LNIFIIFERVEPGKLLRPVGNMGNRQAFSETFKGGEKAPGGLIGTLVTEIPIEQYNRFFYGIEAYDKSPGSKVQKVIAYNIDVHNDIEKDQCKGKYRYFGEYCFQESTYTNINQIYYGRYQKAKHEKNKSRLVAFIALDHTEKSDTA
jgi:hypothetical protein